MLDQAGCAPGPSGWIDEERAADLIFALAPDVARTALEQALTEIDVIVQPGAGRSKSLLIADMDSTMITVECIDELADYAGIRTEVAAVTERAMRGELDFAAALDARVALLAGLPISAVEECLAERVRLSSGARTLVQTMRSQGATTILVSGGFTVFADPVARRIGFDRVIANRLLVEERQLTGRVARPIVDADMKRETLESAMSSLKRDRPTALAVGDGANDIAMIRAAGLGVAYRAKPVLAAAADARIDCCDLTALLYAQGIPSASWV